MKTIARSQAAGEEELPTQKQKSKLIAILTSWELYPILLLAAFFRLARLDTVIFGVDQGNLYQLARDFFLHGFIPMTSYRTSLGPLNPPFFIYLLLIPASISANPMAGMCFMGLLSTLTVVLTYFMTRRYFGRVAGSIASLLFATSPMAALVFGSDIWQPDLVPVLVVPFLMCVFSGIFERRKGWLFPALVLLGLLVQMHSTSIYIAVVLLAACIFAWRTLRIRDVIYAAGVLLITLLPYLALEVKTNFADLKGYYYLARLPAQGTDFGILNDGYRGFLGPYVGSVVERGDLLPNDPNSVMYTTPLRYLVTPLNIIHAILPWLIVVSIIVIALMVLLPLPGRRRPDVELKHREGSLGQLFNWGADLWATPYRQGLLMLLLWQVVPLLLLTRHAVPLYPHYFTFFLPGPFILIGVFFQHIVDLIRNYRPRLKFLVNFAVITCALILIAAQTLCAGQTLIDTIHGNFNDTLAGMNFYNMAGLQPALTQADQLAQERHIGRIYIATSFSDASALGYLSLGLKTPVTLFDGSNCLVLPSTEAGPVVLLETPYLHVADQLINKYSDATLVASPWRAGGDPFKLYVLSAHATPVPVRTLSGGLQQLDSHATFYKNDATSERWLVTRWQVTGNKLPAPRTTYHRDFNIELNGVTPVDGVSCASTRMWSEDQIFGIQSLNQGVKLPSLISIQPYAYTSDPELHHLGPLTFSVFNWQNTPPVPSQASDGQNSFTLAVTGS